MFEEEKNIVKKWLAANVGGDDDVERAFFDAMDPQMTWTLIGSTPISGTHNGLEEIRNNFLGRCWGGDGRAGSAPQGLDPTYGIKPLQVKEVVALEDGRVMVHCKSDGRGKNGVPYANEYCWIVKVANGKLKSMHEFADTALIERAMFNKDIVPQEQIRKG